MRAALIGSGVIGGVLTFALWWTWPRPEPEPEKVAVADVAAREPVRGKSKHRPAERQKARPRPERVEKEPVMEPLVKAEARSEFRVDRMSEVDAELDAYAEKQRWDPELTEEVRSLLVDTMDHIGQRLARVDRGELEWETVRTELRRFRLDRAAELQELLGDEFDGFAEAMEFGRFLGEPPPGRARFER